MNGSYRPLYCPALRMKAGELAGIHDLAADVAAYVLPRLVVPPPSERDSAQPQLFVVDEAPDLSGALSRYWRDRSAFIDVTYLMDEFGRERVGMWLPRMFERARRVAMQAIPTVSLSDLRRVDLSAVRGALNRADRIKLGICISSGEMIGSEFVASIEAALLKLGLTPTECAAIADFHDADFSDPSLVAPVIQNSLELLQDSCAWHHIIFQGTHFPERNPAADGSSELVPRNEWKSWRQAVKFDPSTAAHMLFGDYAADCAKMVFGGSAAAAIRHYRYATESDWLVQRSPKSGSHKEAMETVCKAILGSGHFAGPDFSAADAYIYRTAHGVAGPGNATTWRQINTTHHITRVVVDLGKVRGVAIAKKEIASVGTQMSLLP